MNVTRQVISDLWPLYVAGEASADTRALVESFLAADPPFATALRESAGVGLGVAPAPALAPDHELKALARTRRRLKGYVWLLQLALLFTALSFGRIVSDTSWDVSPRNFIITAAIAAAFWIAFFVSLIRMRARILLVTPGRRSPR
jgi:ferric-dicitrate binding protein FerR (iron transport regulator)